MVMNGHVNVGESFQYINEARIGVIECMGEWEWLQEAINGQNKQKTLKYNAWVPLFKPIPYFKEWEFPKDTPIINEGT